MSKNEKIGLTKHKRGLKFYIIQSAEDLQDLPMAVRL